MDSPIDGNGRGKTRPRRLGIRFDSDARKPLQTLFDDKSAETSAQAKFDGRRTGLVSKPQV
jgi:hypothetical protein